MTVVSFTIPNDERERFASDATISGTFDLRLMGVVIGTGHVIESHVTDEGVSVSVGLLIDDDKVIR